MKRSSRPRDIVMLAYDGAQILDVVGPLQLLAAVNDEMSSPFYTVKIFAGRKGPFRTSSGMCLCADGAYGDVPDAPDTLIVAGGNRAETPDAETIVETILRIAPGARRIVSICTGAFFLARAGLLDRRRATTHWRSVDLLAARFPKIHVECDALYIRDGKVWTSAGVTAGMDLALALIRDDCGEDMTLAIARRHVMFLMRPGGQSQFSAHLAAEAYPSRKLSQLLRWIPEHVGEGLDVPALARRARMSERNFARLFRSETGQTPAAYVERARLDAARRLLSASVLTMAQVAGRVGFGSEERMRRVFQRHLKVSPSAFRERFGSQHRDKTRRTGQ